VNISCRFWKESLTVGSIPSLPLHLALIPEIGGQTRNSPIKLTFESPEKNRDGTRRTVKTFVSG
jgi:hypothetical protein